LGGLNAANMKHYLREDIIAAIGGSWIVKAELVKNRDWEGITAAAARVRQTIDELES
jgi:2-dehydro-3-deoxyphosphogluconate aldolase/(4S)-4-hydroxy-2-oxoglutarate aldolase